MNARGRIIPARPMKISHFLTPAALALAIFLTATAASAQNAADTALLASSPGITLTLTTFQPAFGTGFDAILNQGTLSTPSTVPTLQEFSATGMTPATLDLFCIETGQDSSTSTVGYSIVPLQNADLNIVAGFGTSIDSLNGIAQINSDGTTGIGTTKANMLGLLFAYEFPAGYDPLTFNTDASGNNYLARAALQLAVWQVLETGSFTHLATSGPGFNVTAVAGGNSVRLADAIASANAIMDAVASDGSLTPMGLDAAYSPTAQDFIVPSGSLTQIPEPSAYAMVLAAAASGFSVIRKRQMKSALA